MVLITSMRVTKTPLPGFRAKEKTPHFAINPIRGGIPAKLAIRVSTTQGLTLLAVSSMFSIFILMTKLRNIKSEAQYRRENRKKSFALTKIAISIHPKLNTDE